MSGKFVFYGQTTFIDKPRDTVIQDFQNTYLTGDGSDKDQVNSQIKELIEMVLSSYDLAPDDKEEAVQALHSVAEQVQEQKGTKLALKGTLQAIGEVVSKAADIAVPAMGIIAAVFKLLRLG